MDLSPEIIKRSIQALIRLQEIDGQIFTLNAEKNTPPADFTALKNEFETVQKAVRSAERIFREADRERRALELKSLTLKDDLKRSESKRREVRNTKEEFAATREFESFQKRVTDNETGFQEKTKLAADKAAEKDQKTAQLAEIQTRLTEAEAKRNARLAELASQIAALESKRAEYSSQVDDHVFQLYERVQKIRRGNGVAVVKGSSCGSCFVTIPPQIRFQLEKMEEIITCPSCSRILSPMGEQALTAEPAAVSSAASTAQMAS